MLGLIETHAVAPRSAPCCYYPLTVSMTLAKFERELL